VCPSAVHDDRPERNGGTIADRPSNGWPQMLPCAQPTLRPDATAIERVPSAGWGEAAQFVPIRFCPTGSAGTRSSCWPSTRWRCRKHSAATPTGAHTSTCYLVSMTDAFEAANAGAFLRYRVVSYIQTLLDDALGLGEALTRAAQRKWPDGYRGHEYGRSTIERWWYAYSHRGFSALTRKKRADRDSFPSLTADECCAIDRIAAQTPTLNPSRIHNALCQRPEATSHKASYGPVRRYLIARGFVRLTRQKAQECKAASKLQSSQANERWMQDIQRGLLPEPQLVAELGAVLPAEDLTQLYRCVKGASLRNRRRALAMLSYSKGIKRSTIQQFLKTGECYVDRVACHYREEGILWFTTRRRTGLRKHEQEIYKEAVFAILHSPPSSHGINRTTWRLEDIWRVMAQRGAPICRRGISKIIRKAGYTVRKARIVLTSNDPDYERKILEITNILMNLKRDEKFYSVDEFGPFAVKRQGGRSWMKRGETRSVPQHQKNKGTLIVTAALELSENQVIHFYSENKNTNEMLKLLELLLVKYADQSRIYFSWDAASWHLSKRLYRRVDEINSSEYRAMHNSPIVTLAPLPSRAQFLNVIESVFSGMAKAVIHNSDYQSVDECKQAINRHFDERNQHFRESPKRAGGKIWGKEIVPAAFHHANNCKDPHYR
jgi:transposase